MFSPKAHAVIDYAIAGTFFVSAVLLWRRHRRAAIASVACGVAEAATAAVTDYPGGIRPMINFRTHKRVDGGLATLVTAMPVVLRFTKDPESRLFRTQALAIAAVTGLTEFEEEERRRPARAWRRAA